MQHEPAASEKRAAGRAALGEEANARVYNAGQLDESGPGRDQLP
eukprot:COSAG01_NODE_70632_length_258_cov_0.641509_1_plen_43_part_01